MENKNSIFRRQAIDRISSPEDLDSYLNVTGPGVWLPLIAIVVLLIGVLVWMFLGHLVTTVNVAVVSSGTSVVCYMPEEKLDAAMDVGTVTIAGNTYPLLDDGQAKQFITSETDQSLCLAGNLTEGMAVKPLRVDAPLQAGIYEGEIVVEAIHPIRFIIN